MSNTIATGTWSPTTVLRGDPAKAVREIAERPGRDLQVHGSARLAGTLLSAGVVDTLRLVMAPVVIGSGRRLLTHPSPAAGLRLVQHEATAQGLVLLEYPTTGSARTAHYQGVTNLR
ncbi:dihydrofolate reductase family protein [Streptomonospora sp. PA3]|uniref:dihydrofolate reductase family protein n=1 Tax=Streptomonospora sp. PA3 TaxID=2607326 RepID=UPI0031BAFFB6